MSTRLDVRIPDELNAVLSEYCKRNGSTKTGVIVMLLRVLKDEQLLAIVRKSITVD
jgi:hypothetical protein